MKIETEVVQRVHVLHLSDDELRIIEAELNHSKMKFRLNGGEPRASFDVWEPIHEAVKANNIPQLYPV